jgi:Cdc6-like AAA superfamily ATPase
LPLVESVVVNAFRPGAALDDPFLFTGRRDQVIELAQNLHVVGVCPIIYGARGLGKSSLALQTQRIAMGDVTLLQDYGAHQWILGEDETYLAFYVPCSDSTGDTQGILQRIINSFSSISLDQSTEANQLVDRTTKRQITLKVFQAETQKRFQVPEAFPTYDDLAIDEKLLAMAEHLSQAHEQPVMVIIDELDLVRDTSGLGSFIKNASSEDLKFVLVGIGQNVSSLLSDHQSIERIAIPIQIPLMIDQELSQIVDRAMNRLADFGLQYTFDQSASQRLATLASGFPWFVHVLGQSALLTVHSENRRTVDAYDIDFAARSLADSRFAQQFRDLYQAAVGESWKRELVLRAFALWPGLDIPTSYIYRVLGRLDIANPSPHVAQLSSGSYGPILVRPPLQKRGVWRFANQMFKVYVKVRRPVFDINRRLRQAWLVEFAGTEFAGEAESMVLA